MSTDGALNPEALFHANEEDLRAVVRLFGLLPGGTLYDEPDHLGAISGIPHPVFNAVTAARLREGEVDSRLDAILQPFLERRMPFSWWVGPDVMPPDLCARLKKRGLLQVGRLPAMSVDLARLSPEPPLPRGIKIQRVETTHAIDQWAEVCAESFEVDDELLPDLTAFSRAFGYGPDHSWRPFLALRNDHAVACAAIHLGPAVAGAARVAGVYCVGTMPTARRRGLGAAVVHAALQEARSCGYGIATLQASEMGFGVYRRLGFEQDGLFRLFLWQP